VREVSDRSEVERGLKGSDSEAVPNPGSALILRGVGSDLAVGERDAKICEEKRK